MHIFEVLHHFIKECSVSKWFLTVEGRAVEKMHIVLDSFLIHKGTVWKSSAS